jgi:hypothetical protein
VRQDDRVDLGVRQVEAAAEGVAELVVEPDRRVAEDGPAQPRGDERVAPRLDVARVALQPIERGDARADASGAYRPSAACAIALSMLTTLVAIGSESESSAS